MSASYRRRPQEWCRAGHLYTPENTIWIASSRTFDGKTRNCRLCRAAKLARRPRAQATERMRRWRAANVNRNRLTWRENRRHKKEWLDAQKLKCLRCLETHISCLEFHHREPGQKDFLLSTAVSHCSLKRIQAEVAKCDVLCANCHRKLHWDERQRKLEEREG